MPAIMPANVDEDSVSTAASRTVVRVIEVRSNIFSHFGSTLDIFFFCGVMMVFFLHTEKNNFNRSSSSVDTPKC